MPYDSVKDIEKIRASRRKWYANNSEHAKAKVEERRKELKLWYKEFKSRLKCNRCPENHPATLDFRHLDSSNKIKSIAKTIEAGWSKDRILKEIQKCEVLCSNCHRKEHSKSEG